MKDQELSRVIKAAIHELELEGESARGADPAGHTKIESTIRYLGVDVEDA